MVHDPEGLQRFYWQNNTTTTVSTDPTLAVTDEPGEDLIDDQTIKDLLENDNYPFDSQDEHVDDELPASNDDEQEVDNANDETNEDEYNYDDSNIEEQLNNKRFPRLFRMLW